MSNVNILTYSYRSLTAGPIFESHEIRVDKHAGKFDVLRGTVSLGWFARMNDDSSIGYSAGKSAMLGCGGYRMD